MGRYNLFSYEDETIATNEVDENVNEDGEIEPIITESDVPDDGIPTVGGDEISVEEFNRAFAGLEDDDVPNIDVNVDIETESGDDDDYEESSDSGDPIDEAAAISSDDTSSSDTETTIDSEEASTESFWRKMFGLEDDEIVNEDGSTGDEESDSGDDDSMTDDDDITVDVNVNVSVDDGSETEDDTGSTGGDDAAADQTGEVSQEDFDSFFAGMEDDGIDVDVTVDDETVADYSDDSSTSMSVPDSGDPIDEAAAISSDGEMDSEEEGTEEEDDDDMSEESYFRTLF